MVKTYVIPLVTKGMRLGVFHSAGPPACHGEAYRPPARKCCNSSHEGRAMKEIADLLHVRARTMAFHKYTIMEHLGVKTSTELEPYPLEHGMLKKCT